MRSRKAFVQVACVKVVKCWENFRLLNFLVKNSVSIIFLTKIYSGGLTFFLCINSFLSKKTKQAGAELCQAQGRLRLGVL